MAAHAAGGGLAAALRDLGSPAGRLAAFKAVTEHVYGACPPGGAVGSAWRPRTYADNKSRYLWTDGERGVRAGTRRCPCCTAALHTGRGRRRHATAARPLQPPRLHAPPLTCARVLYHCPAAFGVCNYLTLACETGERRWLEQADALIQGGWLLLSALWLGAKQGGRVLGRAPRAS